LHIGEGGSTGLVSRRPSFEGEKRYGNKTREITGRGGGPMGNGTGGGREVEEGLNSG